MKLLEILPNLIDSKIHYKCAPPPPMQTFTYKFEKYFDSFSEMCIDYHIT